MRTEIYRPVAELLEAHCAEGAVAIVVVDDLHHADEDTLVLIGFLVRRLVDVPLTWILTSRPHVAEPTPGLAALLHRLREDGRLDEVVLTPLPDADITRLAEAAVGRTARRSRCAAVIVERAAGNPFFAIQLALSLAEARRARGPMDQERSVPSVSRRVALLERVFPLGEQARSVARLASVFGDIDLDRLEGLAAVLGLDVAEVQDGFDRLVRADLLRPVGERYEFVHDLVRETLYGDLGPAERRRLHGAAARCCSHVAPAVTTSISSSWPTTSAWAARAPTPPRSMRSARRATSSPARPRAQRRSSTGGRSSTCPPAARTPATCTSAWPERCTGPANRRRSPGCAAAASSARPATHGPG